MKIAIHQPQYMPWVGYFHKMASVDLFVFLDDVQFKKNEWQHRNRIRGSRGAVWISVPNHYRFPQRMCEVCVGNESPWREKHLGSIIACYGKSPFFALYRDLFEEFFATEHTTINTLNVASVTLCAQCMNLDVPCIKTSDFAFPGVASERLVAICRHFGADTYLAGAGGRDYMDMAVFERYGIRVEFQHFIPPIYPQRWSGGERDFLPGLSAIDLLFNCGPQSLSVLMGKM